MKVKCRVCGQSIEKEDATEVECRHWCCNECVPKYFDISTPEGAERSLYSYIWKLCDKDANFAMLKKQIKNYQKENGWTNAGMYLTAVYFVEILNQQWNAKYGIGQLFNNDNYRCAQTYYKHKNQIKQMVDQMDFTEKATKVQFKTKTLAERNKHKMIEMED